MKHQFVLALASLAPLLQGCGQLAEPSAEVGTVFDTSTDSPSYDALEISSDSTSDTPLSDGEVPKDTWDATDTRSVDGTIDTANEVDSSDDMRVEAASDALDATRGEADSADVTVVDSKPDTTDTVDAATESAAETLTRPPQPDNCCVIGVYVGLCWQLGGAPIAHAKDCRYLCKEVPIPPSLDVYCWDKFGCPLIEDASDYCKFFK